MKKTIKYLLLFVFLFLVGVRVEADTVYKEDWFSNYNYSDNYSYFWDVIALDDGSIGLGERDYTINNVDYYGGMIAKYDLNGELVWTVEKENNYYLKGVNLNDGFVVLTQFYETISDTEENAYILLQKFDYDGEKVWESKIVEGEVGYDLINLISFDIYDDKMVIGFNNSTYIYDDKGNLLTELVVDSLLLPSITIGENGIYVSGVDSNGNTVLEKYNLSTFVKEDSKIIYEGTVDSENDIIDVSLVLDIEYVKGNIIVSSYNSSEKSEIAIYNSELELIEKNEIDSIVVEIQRHKNTFITVGGYHNNNPKGIDVELLDYINNINEFNFNIEDAKVREKVVFHVNIFDLNLDKQWNAILKDYYVYSVDSINDRFIISGHEYYDNASLMQFVKSFLDRDWSSTGNLDEVEYFYDVSYYENGYIAVGWSTECLPRGIPDAKEMLALYGKIVNYDKDGNVLWYRNLAYESEIIKVATVEDGFFVFVNDHENTMLHLIKYSYEGEIIKVQDLGSNILEEDEFDIVKLSGYGNYFSLVFDGIILLFDKDLEIVDTFYENYDMNTNYTLDVDMNENGIYLVYGNNDNGDIIVQKYDVNMNFIAEKTIIESSYNAPYDINQYGDKIFLLFDNSVYVLKNDLSLIKNIELNHYEYFDVIGTDEGFDVLGTVLCESKGIGSKCENTGFIMNYNLDNDKISYVSLDYLPYGSDNVNGSIVVAGYGYTDAGYSMVAYAEKYSYPIYNVGVATDGNGTVTSSVVETSSGSEVEFTVEPKDGYALKKVTVITSSGEVLEFTDYKFTMPSEDVEIYAEFELLPNNPNTGLNNPFVICGGIFGLALVASLIVKKKKFI